MIKQTSLRVDSVMEGGEVKEAGCLIAALAGEEAGLGTVLVVVVAFPLIPFFSFISRSNSSLLLVTNLTTQRKKNITA